MKLTKNDLRIGTMKYPVMKYPDDYTHIKEIVLAEIEKQSNPDYLWHIRNLENLPYFNGLVGNVLNLLDDENHPIRSNFRLTNDIKTRNKKEVEESLNMIYKYLSKNDISLNDFVYGDNTIITQEYTEAKYARDEYITPVTLCDFFTDPMWKKYVKDYIIGEFPNSINEAQCGYLYAYNWLPVSWLATWKNEFRITFFKDRLNADNWNQYVGVANSEISYLTLQDIFGKITDEDMDINTYIEKCWNDAEFRNNFVIKVYYGCQ